MRQLRFTIFFIFVLLSSPCFAQENTFEFETAEKMFLKGYTEGDFSKWNEADTAFKALLEAEDILTPQQHVSALMYQVYIFIRYSYANEEQLEKINTALTLYDSFQLEEKELLQELSYLKELIRLRLQKEDAVDNLKKLLEEIKNEESVNNKVVANIHDQLYEVYYKEKDYRKSLYHAHLYKKYIQKTPYHYLYSSALHAIGAVHYNLDEIDSCLYYMKETYRLTKEGSNPEPLSMAGKAFNIAMIYQGKTGQFVEAEDYFKEAIHNEILSRGEESPQLIVYYSLLADNYYFLKDMEPALHYAEKGFVLANDILKTDNVYLKSMPSMSLSRIYANKGDFEKARKVIDKVVEESIDYFGENDKFTTQAYIDKAYVEERAKNYKEAEKYFLLAVSSSEAIGRVYSILSAYTNLTTMYLQIEDYDKALHYAQLAHELQAKSLDNDAKIFAIDALKLVRAHLGLGNIAEAERHLAEAKRILQINERDFLIETETLALENKILYQKYLNGEEQALQQAFSQIDVLMSAIINGRSEYNYQNSKLFYSQTVAPFIESAFQVAKSKYNTEQEEIALQKLFQLMEMNKSSILLDGILDMKVRAEKGIPLEVADYENNLRVELSQVQRELSKVKQDSIENTAQLNQLIDKQLLLNSKIDSVKQHLKENYPDWYNAKNIVSVKPIDHYQNKVLKKNQMLIEYYFAKSGLYRLMISADEVIFSELAASETIQSLTDSLIYGILEIKDIRQEAIQLASKILPEIPDGVSEIIIVPDGKLTQIPFEILIQNDKYLIEEYYISYASSFQLYEEQVAISKKKSKAGWLGFAPDYKETKLPNNKIEVSTISALTSGKAVVGSEATKNKFLNNSKEATILHLATHADLDRENPMLNKMVFYEVEGQPNELTAAEIYNLNLNASLAVLSACNTGIGKADSGDGVLSMSRAFTYAGVSSTIMSLWQVPDNETAEIMILFYEHLKDGKAKNEALALAKRDFITNNPLKSHPYFWAGFVVNGDLSPIFEPTIHPLIWAILAIVLILIFWKVLLVRKKSQGKV